MKSAIYYKVNDDECNEPIFTKLFPKCIWKIFDTFNSIFSKNFYFSHFRDISLVSSVDFLST